MPILVERACDFQRIATYHKGHLLRYWRFYVGSVITALLLSATDTPAATITVTNGNDSGLGSLRRAINFASPGDTINFAPSVDNTTGVALAEAYDLSPDTSSILGNISTRAFVQTGDNVMIGGFIVEGVQSKRVIIRAIGPELSQYGVPNPLADPTLELHDSTGALMASNDNWMTTVFGGIITSDQVHDITDSGHAPTDPRESAIIATLPPGNHTAIVRGVNNTTGVGLVEVYDLDQ